MTALQNYSVSTSNNDPYYSQHDEAELARIQSMSAGQGLGDVLNVQDDEMSGLMSDLGFGYDIAKDSGKE